MGWERVTPEQEKTLGEAGALDYWRTRYNEAMDARTDLRAQLRSLDRLIDQATTEIQRRTQGQLGMVD